MAGGSDKEVPKTVAGKKPDQQQPPGGQQAVSPAHLTATGKTALQRIIQAPLPRMAVDHTMVHITLPLLRAAMLAEDAKLPLTHNPASPYAYQALPGELFTQGPGAKSDISPDDAFQSDDLGDCYLISSLAAIAAVNPELIRRMVVQLAPHKYEVTLYEPQGFLQGSKLRKLIVDDQFPFDKGKERYAPRRTAGEDGPELWVMLIEKAYAMLAGSYEQIGRDAPTTPDAFDVLLKGGRDGMTFTNDTSVAQIGTLVDGALRAGRPVTCGSDDGSPGSQAMSKRLQLIREHAYAIVKIDLASQKIYVRDPHKSPDPAKAYHEISIAEFKEAFTFFSIGNV